MLVVTAIGLAWPVLAAAAPRILPAGAVLRGHFAQDRAMPGFTAPLHSEGDFTVAPGHGVIWRTTSPFATVTIITPAGIAQEVNGQRTMTMTASRIPFLAHLYGVIGGMMSGDRRALDADFAVTERGAGKNWTLRAVPRRLGDPSLPFTAIDVAGDRLVERVTLTRADGGADRLVFSGQAVSTGALTEGEKDNFAAVAP